MTVPVPENPKIYHIVHIDRLESIIADGYLSCDVEMARHDAAGTTIGMSGIKQRRRDLKLHSHNSLSVGNCVPFYFCPRSVMLYVIYKANHQELSYRGGQEPIVHLEANLYATIDWGEQHGKRWAFTLSNAGAKYFEDRCDLEKLGRNRLACRRSHRLAGVQGGETGGVFNGRIVSLDTCTTDWGPFG